MKALLVGIVFVCMGGYYAYKGWSDMALIDALIESGERAQAVVTGQEIKEEQTRGRRGRLRTTHHYWLSCEMTMPNGQKGRFDQEVSRDFYAASPNGATLEVVYDKADSTRRVFPADRGRRQGDENDVKTGGILVLVGLVLVALGEVQRRRAKPAAA